MTSGLKSLNHIFLVVTAIVVEVLLFSEFQKLYHLFSIGIIGRELMDSQTYVNSFIYLFNKYLLRTEFIPELLNTITNLQAVE